MMAPSPSSPHGLDCSSGGISDASVSTHKSVDFSTVEIREFPRVLGDNPSVTCGPPVALDWGFDPAVHHVDLDRYEETKPPSRDKSQMLVPRHIREEWLMDAGCSRGEIACAVRDVNRAKAHRNRTVNNCNLFRFQAAAESLRRKLGRAVLRREHDSSLYRKWAEECGGASGGNWTRRTQSAPAAAMRSASLHACTWHSSRTSTSSTSEASPPTQTGNDVEGGPVLDVTDRSSSSAPECLQPRPGWDKTASCPVGLSFPNEKVEISGLSSLPKIQDEELNTEKDVPRRDSVQTSGESSDESRPRGDPSHLTKDPCPTCGNKCNDKTRHVLEASE